ncbi:MAG TPA: hypothetical protein VJ879_05210, partial [Desulfobacter sp.]|nr:hypothetical protein [Desulfobacter sp.]
MKIAILWLSCLFLGLLVLFAPVSKAQVVNEAIVSRFSDINFQIWGNTLTKPIFLDNADFNDEDTPLEIIGDTGGIYRDHAIAQMVELGFSGGGENWTFLAVLEAEFILDKDN